MSRVTEIRTDAPVYLPGVGVTLSPDFIGTGVGLCSAFVSADVDLAGDFAVVVIGVFPGSLS